MAAGVLVHQFDGTEADEPWLPCPPTKWCGDIGDRLSASLINKRLPYLFKEGGAGIVLAPPATRIRCSYFGDGGTMPRRCTNPPATGCVPGCCSVEGYPDWCEDVRLESQAVYGCAFKPTDLDAMLRHHELRANGGSGQGYNEVIIDPTVWTETNVGVEAFYFVYNPAENTAAKKPGSGGNNAAFEEQARQAHLAFHAKYGSTMAVPLVKLVLVPEEGEPVFTRVG